MAKDPDRAAVDARTVCAQCRQPIDESYRLDIREYKRRHGRPVTDPKICAVCLWDALMNIDLNGDPND